MKSFGHIVLTCLLTIPASRVLRGSVLGNTGRKGFQEMCLLLSLILKSADPVKGFWQPVLQQRQEVYPTAFAIHMEFIKCIIAVQNEPLRYILPWFRTPERKS